MRKEVELLANGVIEGAALLEAKKAELDDAGKDVAEAENAYLLALKQASEAELELSGVIYDLDVNVEPKDFVRERMSIQLRLKAHRLQLVSVKKENQRLHTQREQLVRRLNEVAPMDVATREAETGVTEGKIKFMQEEIAWIEHRQAELRAERRGLQQEISGLKVELSSKFLHADWLEVALADVKLANDERVRAAEAYNRQLKRWGKARSALLEAWMNERVLLGQLALMNGITDEVGEVLVEVSGELA